MKEVKSPKRPLLYYYLIALGVILLFNMSLVNMGGKYKLVLATQYFFCQLHPDLMGFLRRDLPRLKRLDEVAAQVRALSIAWRRVQANSMSAVSAEQPKEDTSSLPSVLSGLQI